MKWFWRILAAGIILTALVSGAWLIAVPEGLLISLIEDPRGGELRAEVSNFKKGLFYSFSADRITLIKGDTELLLIDNVSGRIDLPSLLLVRLTMFFSGEVSGGRFEGRVDIRRNGIEAGMGIDAAEIEGIPFFKSVGLGAKGMLSGEIELKNRSGEARFSITDAELKGRSFSGVMVPLNMFNAAQGAVTISRGALKIKSFSLKGEGIYARVKGDVKARVLDLTIEIMPEASFKEKTLLWAIMQYQVSPGYYVIPVKGDLTQGS